MEIPNINEKTDQIQKRKELIISKLGKCLKNSSPLQINDIITFVQTKISETFEQKIKSIYQKHPNYKNISHSFSKSDELQKLEECIEKLINDENDRIYKISDNFISRITEIYNYLKQK